ncbi:MAG: hypothetical protein MZW92_58060 [Comamonadaceae bacterium]|nr:hypothetical protein [Comamonadaceae bacterium]
MLLSTARAEAPERDADVAGARCSSSKAPLVGCVVGASHFSVAALKATRECVIAVPTAELALEVVRCGGCSGATSASSRPSSCSRCRPSGSSTAVRSVTPTSSAASWTRASCRAWVVRPRGGPRLDRPNLQGAARCITAAEGRFMVAEPTVRLPSRMR